MSGPHERSAFVWFHVSAAHEAAVVAALRACHRAWTHAMPGLSLDLLRRANDDAERITLMEIWRGPGAEAACDRLEGEARAALAPWPIGPRHVEWFEPCA